jgi:hypothetical protein
LSLEKRRPPLGGSVHPPSMPPPMGDASGEHDG